MAEGGRKREGPRFDGLMAGSRGIGLPAVRVLSDEHRDAPEPEDSDRVPAPETPGLVRRAAAWIRGHRTHGDAAGR